MWQPIATAPHDQRILVYGQPSDLEMDGATLVWYNRPGIHMAEWDAIDRAFCLDGGSWLGPFIEPTHWMPLPDPPPES